MRILGIGFLDFYLGADGGLVVEAVADTGAEGGVAQDLLGWCY